LKKKSARKLEPAERKCAKIGPFYLFRLHYINTLINRNRHLPARPRIKDDILTDCSLRQQQYGRLGMTIGHPRLPALDAQEFSALQRRSIFIRLRGRLIRL
jgi:hypothetical protein